MLRSFFNMCAQTFKVLSVKLAAILAIVAATLASCAEPGVVSAFETLPPEGWEREHVVALTPDTVRADAAPSATLSLRTSSRPAYPFRDITLVVERRIVSPAEADSAALSGAAHSEVSTDTLRLSLTTPSGTPTGAGTSIFQYDFPLGAPFHVAAGSVVTYRIAHFMRSSPLEGIREVGITLRP